MKETAIGQLASAHLADVGWRCYYEVETVGLWGRPDIVATRGKLTLIAECKTTMGLAVLSQAMRHCGCASYVVVVTPRTRSSLAAMDVLRRNGIGWLQVRKGTEPPICRWEVAPTLCRRCDTRWVSKLEPEHETLCEPGSADGGYWTPFRRTCEEVRRFVVKHPGATTRELIAGICHHYSADATARGSLLHWAQAGKIPGIAIEYEGRSVKWLPATVSNTR